MNVALTDDLQGLVRMKVENGQFPSEQAVIEEALRLFLIEKPDAEHPRASDASGQEKERQPGPFIEDEAAPAPGDLPRSGQEIACLYLHDVTRQPDLFPGD
jgi:Arc/MetJ-type ribon-helix-helix transcriptional regulator